jgi:L-amino acid N-acyltransferase YncA
MTQELNIYIRPMQNDEKKAVRNDEKKAVRDMMNRSFPLVQRWFFSFTPHVLVAEQNGQLLGATVLKIVSLPGNRKGGLVYWVFTAPEARGMGAAQRLVEAALCFFEDRGCDDVMACVEGYNTSSSKLFSTRGFTVLSPGQQFRRYGIGTLPLWVKIFHYLDIGHFLWVRPGSERPDNPALQWWGSVLMNALIAWLALWRQSGFHKVNPTAFPAVLLASVFFFGLRELAMRLTANQYRLPVRYRAWESGFPLSLALALVFGAQYPVPGSVYPTSYDWRYRDLIPRLGPIALAGALSVLVLTWGASALPHLSALPSEIETWISVAGFVGKPLALLDIALPFVPFVSFNGRRIWDWNRVVWGVLAAAAVAVLFV